MVAIVVALAAVVGTLAFGLTDEVGETAPRVQVAVTDAGDAYDGTANQTLFSVAHGTGDTMAATDLRLVVSRVSTDRVVGEFDPLTATDAPLYVQSNGRNVSAGDEFGPGDSLSVLDAAASTLDAGAEYEVVLVHRPTESQVAAETVRLE
jgi:FlaG/FlaF family flagellin (archaellin)